MVINISVAKAQSLEYVSELIEQFVEYEELFSPIFLHYNGKTEIVSLQYRLKTSKSYNDESEFLKNFLEQYLKNPIQIPSELFSVEINDRRTFKNLAENSQYFFQSDGFYFFNISNLINLDTDYIDILIDTKYKLDLNSLISSNITKQPKLIQKKTYKYELTSFLKSNNFPENFQFLDVPISYELTLNDFLEHFINKKFFYAEKKYLELEIKGVKHSRKKSEYSKIIENGYGLSPLKFNKQIQVILEAILNYIQQNYSKVIEINCKEGVLMPEIPQAYYRAKQTGILILKLKFKTNYNQKDLLVKSDLIFNFKWMKNLFNKYLPKKRTYPS